MEASNAGWQRRVWGVALGICLLGAGAPLSLCAAQSAAKPAQDALPAQASPEADEQNALVEAFRSANDNPQVLLKNLEAFLARFPKSSRKQLVLRTICTYALEANAPAVAVQYGQMLLEMTPDDPQLLAVLMEALARLNDPASRTRAIDCASRLVRVAEAQRDRAVATGTRNHTPQQWAQRIAAIYAQRAGFYQDSGDLDRALADYEKSYQTYATARVAEREADIALRKGDSARAVDEYLTAFVFPDEHADPAHRREIRCKLGSLYVAQHHSEQGLGDLLLSRYDALLRQLGGRFSADSPQSAGRHDPFDYVLEQTDGTPLPLAKYRGKILVMDFWATWCGPCRLQGKLVEQVAESFRGNTQAVFLALNTDHDRSGVPAFLKKEGWTLPVAYAQGLDQMLGVRELPTLVIFDRQGQVVFRQEGVDPDSFVAELGKRLREVLPEAGANGR